MGFLKRKNTKKEARMKKFIVIALALFLAIPAISFAGSATSRWDVTIGGYIKADFGYATQGQGASTQGERSLPQGTKYLHYAPR